MRDAVCWLVAVLLFCSGVIFSLLLPNIELSFRAQELNLTELFSAISALATAVAAYAAFRSAKISNESVEISRQAANQSMKVSHRQQFESLLDRLESMTNIIFMRRDSLYRDLFPDNFQYDRAFNPVSDGVLFQKVGSLYAELRDSVMQVSPPTPSGMDVWMFNLSELIGGHLRAKRQIDGRQQIYLNGGRETGLFSDTLDGVVQDVSYVINGLCSFAAHEQIAPCFNIWDAFRESFKRYYYLIINSATDHTVQ